MKALSFAELVEQAALLQCDSAARAVVNTPSQETRERAHRSAVAYLEARRAVENEVKLS